MGAEEPSEDRYTRAALICLLTGSILHSDKAFAKATKWITTS